MRIIRAADCRTTPWKNGGGATTEIAVAPDGASLDGFDWRVSMARVASDGPFSEFAGIDRSLAVVTGEGLALAIGGEDELALGSCSDPVRFPGDAPTSARLLGGEIVDLNVMTRRGKFTHRLVPIRQVGEYDKDFDLRDGDLMILVSPLGATTIALDDDTVTLARGDAAMLTWAGHTRLRIAPAATTTCYLVLLRDIGGQTGLA